MSRQVGPGCMALPWKSARRVRGAPRPDWLAGAASALLPLPMGGSFGVEETGVAQTCRFGIRRYPNGGSAACFEVFDRMTGAAVASGMRRVEAEDDARRRNQDLSRPAAMTLHLGPADLAALRAAVDAY
jgi:hypothetical protein